MPRMPSAGARACAAPRRRRRSRPRAGAPASGRRNPFERWPTATSTARVGASSPRSIGRGRHLVVGEQLDDPLGTTLRVRDEDQRFAAIARLPELGHPIGNAPGELHRRLGRDVADARRMSSASVSSAVACSRAGARSVQSMTSASTAPARVDSSARLRRSSPQSACAACRSRRGPRPAPRAAGWDRCVATGNPGSSPSDRASRSSVVDRSQAAETAVPGAGRCGPDRCRRSIAASTDRRCAATRRCRRRTRGEPAGARRRKKVHDARRVPRILRARRSGSWRV